MPNSFAIFTEPDGRKKQEAGDRIQGDITSEGSKHFELARKRLKWLYRQCMGATPPNVGDADTIEHLARGEANTRTYLRKKLQQHEVTHD